MLSRYRLRKTAHGGSHVTAGGNGLKETAAHGKPTEEQACGTEPMQEQTFCQELRPVGDPL